MNEQSAFIIKEESHGKIVKENEEEKRKEIKREQTNARQRAYYQRQKELKKKEGIVKKVPKSNAERQRKFRERNAELSYMDKKRRKSCSNEEKIVRCSAVENIENVTLQENQFHSQQYEDIHEQQNECIIPDVIVNRNTGIPGDENESGISVKRHYVAIVSTNDDGLTIFTCVECSEEFDQKDDLQLHLMQHYNEYKFVCGVCGRGLKRREHLDRHMQEHSDKRPHVCPECGKGFKRREHLNIHMTIHSDVKVLACHVCDKKFNRKDHLHKHIQTHNKHIMSNIKLSNVKTEVEDEDIKTEPTDVASYTESDQTTEMDTDCSNDGNQFDESYDAMAYDLAKQFLVAKDEMSYDKYVNGGFDPERPHVCPLCGKSYKRKDHLKIHSWTHKKKEKFCTQCGKAFHTSDQLLVHVNLSHVRPFDTNGTAPKNLESWQQKGAGSHECGVCHRKFKRKQHLKTHYNVHAKNNVAQPIWCSSCNEGFYNSTLYEGHQCHAEGEGKEEGEEEPRLDKKENNPMELLEVVVGEGPEEAEARIPSPRRVYVCKVCGKSFKRKDHFKIHQFIHTGVKTVFCPDCNKGFYRKDHLQKHMIVHARMRTKPPPKPKKHIPDLFPIHQLPHASFNNNRHARDPLAPDAHALDAHDSGADVVPEITIHAPSSSKLRVPLKIKVPYQMVMSLDNGEKRAFTVDPQTSGV